MIKKIVKYIDDDVLVIKLEFEKQCDGGNIFHITAHLYDRDYISFEGYYPNKNGNNRYLGSCGCLHDEIAIHAPELKHLIKWHGTSTNGPLYYIENTLYHVDEHGPTHAWIYYTPTTTDPLGLSDCKEILLKYAKLEKLALAEKYPCYRIELDKKTIKECNLDAARRSAVWPEATREDLTRENLLKRLPKLMEDFNGDMKEIFGI